MKWREIRRTGSAPEGLLRPDLLLVLHLMTKRTLSRPSDNSRARRSTGSRGRRDFCHRVPLNCWYRTGRFSYPSDKSDAVKVDSGLTRDRPPHQSSPPLSTPHTRGPRQASFEVSRRQGRAVPVIRTNSLSSEKTKFLPEKLRRILFVFPASIEPRTYKPISVRVTSPKLI
jgi:hypothetical protein